MITILLAPQPQISPLIPLKCEIRHPNTNWARTWKLARLLGLGPDLSSFIHKILWGILPTRERLNKILPLSYSNPLCQLCGDESQKHSESLIHALMQCKANKELPTLLLKTLQHQQPTLTFVNLITLDLDLDPTLELPLIWITCSMLFSIWTQREEGEVNVSKTRAFLEARCRLLREGKVKNIRNAHALTEILLQNLFNST